MKAGRTLLHELRRSSLKWVVGTFTAALVLSSGIFLWLTISAEELRVKTLAQSVARVFRPRILENDIRDVQSQMSFVLQLGEREHAVLRGKDFNPLYSMRGSKDLPNCRINEGGCWDVRRFSYTYIQPIYFNDDVKDSVFGYLELRLSSKVNGALIVLFLSSLLMVFGVLLLGVFSTQAYFVRLIQTTLSLWSVKVRDSLMRPAESLEIPFEEFRELGEVIETLNARVELMRESVAVEAKTKAQLSVVRGIGHDLKTPFSQARKYYEALLAKYQRTNSMDAEVAGNVKRSLDRLGDLLKQMSNVNRFELRQVSESEFIDIATEAHNFVNDILMEPGFHERRIDVRVDGHGDVAHVLMPRVQFYRLLDNLIRNALDALTGRVGLIEVMVGSFSGHPTLFVSDNGCGIPKDNLARIFDPEFTTKASRGTGIGLSVVKSICADIGAEVLVESEVEIGTTFRVQFSRTLVTSTENDGITEIRKASL